MLYQSDNLKFQQNWAKMSGVQCHLIYCHAQLSRFFQFSKYAILLQVGRVDCSRARNECNNLHLHSFPKFILFKSGGGHEFHHGEKFFLLGGMLGAFYKLVIFALPISKDYQSLQSLEVILCELSSGTLPILKKDPIIKSFKKLVFLMEKTVS